VDCVWDESDARERGGKEQVEEEEGNKGGAGFYGCQP